MHPKEEVDQPMPTRALWRGRIVLTGCGFVQFHNSQLQKSRSRIFGQNSGNSIDISKALFKMVIWKFESNWRL
jgi:hypothetical protein